MRAGRCVAGILVLVAALPARAGFRLPGDVFAVERLAAAKAEARASNRPITFLFTDADTRCGLATEASLDVLRELGEHSVMVYVDSGGGKKIPAVVRRALRSPEAGRYIPKTVVTDAAVSRVLCIVPYVRDRGERLDRLFEARREMKKHLEEATRTGPADAAGEIELVLRWEGDLRPMPLVTVTGFLRSMGYNQELIRSGPTGCRFRVRSGLPTARLRSQLTTFLEAHYLVRQAGGKGPRLTFRLAPLLGEP